MPDSPPTRLEEPPETQIAVPSAPVTAARTESAPAGKTKHSRRRWVWLYISILLLLGGTVYFLRPKITVKSGGAATKAAAKGPAPIRVVAAKSRKGDIGVYYSGLGAVTPLGTVTVRTRVDGQLMSVRYREGDTVQKGDLLAEIDDGPYQAALTQAEGALIRDQALLANARVDLARYQTLAPQQAIPEQQLDTQQARASGRGRGET
jgi:membrane fusion protein, multidrug efflux system